MGVAVFIIGIIIAILLSRSIIVPLRKLMESTETITHGDLRHSVVLRSKDEFGKLSQAFDQMRLNLGKLIQQINVTSNQIASSSEELTASAEETGKATEQISNAMHEVSVGTEQQACTTANSLRSVSEISHDVNQVAEAIQSVTVLSNRAKEHAGTGNQIVTQTLVQMDDIHDKVHHTAEVIHRLEQKSKEIGQIVSLITEISNQTNLLALNAAIESARAGEHGKGFAIVADEVKKLAAQSSQSADEIRELIEQIQLETHQAVQSMCEGTTSVKDGMKMTSQTGEFFNDISTIIEEITSQTHEVSAVIEEVNANTDSMVDTMNVISHSSEETAANTQNVSAATEEQNASMEEIFASAEALSLLATNLQESVNQFKL